ncbi:MAG: Holliday junction resolvase RuvX [Clostridia bacterium]|nr:Holliday junction resolvase RuvX [Clostridia bacterium]
MRTLAVDLGLARTGLALSDELGLLASPLKTITQSDLSLLLDQVADIAKLEQAGEIVVGLPRNMDGSLGESAQRAKQFAENLQQKTGLPVHLWDERLTTKSAIGILNETNVRGKKRKNVVDTVAAIIILEDFLRSRK